MREVEKIHITDIKDDEIIFFGDVENINDFRTKKEWIEDEEEFLPRMNEVKNHGEKCYTAYLSCEEISLEQLAESIQDNGIVYEDWYDHVVVDMRENKIIEDGIAEINRTLRRYPTYFEDKEVVFD
ncbi:hypothetical protein LQZ18_04165 [Lachnospiraceae bacterium ZAX-1]